MESWRVPNVSLRGEECVYAVVVELRDEELKPGECVFLCSIAHDM